MGTVLPEPGHLQTKPLKIQGKYYYNSNDMHNHMKRALTFLPRTVGKKLTSLPLKIMNYYSTNASDHEPVLLRYELPSPTQSKPSYYPKNPTVTWIGHASALIQVDGFNVLTDPVFGDVKAHWIPIAQRIVAPGITIDNLPPIDAVVISHNHADHCDKKSLLAIHARYPQARFLVGEGTRALLESFGIAPCAVIEKSWWDSWTVQKHHQSMTLTFLPAKHWSIYVSPWSYREALWGSWMISAGNTNIYFAGDTAYDDHFKQIGDYFDHIDIALMPIGPTYQDSFKHNCAHINAREAIEAFIELKAACFIPIHWGTFWDNPESLAYPINLMYDYWKELESTLLAHKKLLVLGWGHSYSLANA